MKALADGRASESSWLVPIALISFLVLAFTWAALDDITTGHESDFRLEYAFLVVAATWFTGVGVQLIRRRHRVLGALSLVALAGALWAHRQIGPGIVPGLWPAYVATLAAFVWFAALSAVLLVLGSRRRSA